MPKAIPKVDCICPICAAPFQAAQHRVNHTITHLGGSLYCSRACANAAKRMDKKPFPSAAHTPEARQKRVASTLASPKLGHRKDMICDGCGTAFLEYGSRRPRLLKFCTQRCGLDFQQRQKHEQKQHDMDADPKNPGIRMTVTLENKEIKQK